mgnify:CR=1 FL=1
MNYGQRTIYCTAAVVHMDVHTGGRKTVAADDCFICDKWFSSHRYYVGGLVVRLNLSPAVKCYPNVLKIDAVVDWRERRFVSHINPTMVWYGMVLVWYGTIP